MVLCLQPSLSRHGAYLHCCEARWRPERTVRRNHQAFRAQRLQAGRCQIHTGKHDDGWMGDGFNLETQKQTKVKAKLNRSSFEVKKSYIFAGTHERKQRTPDRGLNLSRQPFVKHDLPHKELLKLKFKL